MPAALPQPIGRLKQIMAADPGIIRRRLKNEKLSRNTVYKWASFVRSPVTSSALTVARCLGVTVEYLWGYFDSSMADVNTLTITGTIVDAPALKSTQSGTAFAGFQIRSTPQSVGTFQKPQMTLSCTLWGKTAQQFVDEVRTDTRVLLAGSLEAQEWKDKGTGATKSRLTMNVSAWSKLDAPGTPDRNAPIAANDTGSTSGITF